VAKRKSCPSSNKNPGHPAHSVITILTHLPWLTPRLSKSIITGRVCLFIRDLFQDDVSSSDYKVLNEMMIDEKLIGKGIKGSGHSLIYDSILASACRN
jgi:hypothetical protein